MFSPQQAHQLVDLRWLGTLGYLAPVIRFSPIFAALWAWLGRRRADLPPMFKFALALLQVGAGFLFLIWGGQVLDPAAALHSAIQVFTWIGVAGMAFGVVFLVAGPFVRRWGEGADEVAAAGRVAVTS